MKLNKFGFPILSLILSSFASHANADIAQGKALHDQSCTACHTTSVYTRSDKRISSLSALQGQVSRCTKPAGAEWDKQEIMDVVDYLNSNFYRFKSF